MSGSVPLPAVLLALTLLSCFSFAFGAVAMWWIKTRIEYVRAQRQAGDDADVELDFDRATEELMAWLDELPEPRRAQLRCLVFELANNPVRELSDALARLGQSHGK